jgi:hypothetical protein
MEGAPRRERHADAGYLDAGALPGLGVASQA